jgi:hypothetical protein
VIENDDGGPSLPPIVEHVYVSTYCAHGLCADCRRSCKICEAPCQHACHRSGGESGTNEGELDRRV